MFRMCISEAELRKALEDIEKAKARGFSDTLAIMQMSETGQTLSDDVLTYEGGLILLAHPTDPSKNWGYVKREWIDWYKYENGTCVETY